MENPNKPIYPLNAQFGGLDGELKTEYQSEFSLYQMSGLTKREYFAGLAMQGICANSDWAKDLTDDEWDSYTHRLTSGAVEIADKLLKQLEITKI